MNHTILWVKTFKYVNICQIIKSGNKTKWCF